MERVDLIATAAKQDKKGWGERERKGVAMLEGKKQQR
jgi:hypothetical protein